MGGKRMFRLPRRFRTRETSARLLGNDWQAGAGTRKDAAPAVFGDTHEVSSHAGSSPPSIGLLANSGYWANLA